MKSLLLASLILVASLPASLNATQAVRPVASPACRTEVLEDEISAGQLYRKPIGNGLDLMLQPIHSGWILRVLPQTATALDLGDPAYLDYAALATPPYQSITPLSLSTDFAFRAQDALGWNPRRFRFAGSSTVYQALRELYGHFQQQAKSPEPLVQSQLAALAANSPEGVLTILDSRLIPGTADQWAGAAAVSSAFTETAHTIVLPENGKATPLGKILFVRFRVQLELPAGFHPAPGVKIMPHLCGSR